jgi:hypothetical protein
MSTLTINEHAQPTTEIMNWLKPSFDARIDTLTDEFFNSDSQNSYNRLLNLLDNEAIPYHILTQIEEIFVEGSAMMITHCYLRGVEDTLNLKSNL